LTIADAVDVALGVQPLGIDFFRSHELAFAVRSGLIDMPALDQFRVAIPRIRALLVLGLRDILIDRLFVVDILRRRFFGRAFDYGRRL
jgi:hypothetical protein